MAQTQFAPTGETRWWVAIPCLPRDRTGLGLSVNSGRVMRDWRRKVKNGMGQLDFAPYNWLQTVPFVPGPQSCSAVLGLGAMKGELKILFGTRIGKKPDVSNFQDLRRAGIADSRS